MHTYHRPILALAVVLATWPGAQNSAHAQAAETVTLPHVHGLSYSADGKRLIVAVHDGIAVYNAGRWSKDPGPRHDYMGFSATKDSFYSSGHPARGSGHVNPFGLIRSTDGGKTWTKLGLEGESDFHLLAASFGTNAVYLYNPAPNSRMKTAGLYYTLNNGFMWKRARADGFEGVPANLAVHPSDPKVVVLASKTGFYLSTDSGENFRAISKGAQGLAAFFDLDGEHLWLSSYAGAPTLARTNLKNGQNDAITLPPLTRDAVAYVAQNPVNRNEYAIATFERNVFTTQDGGKTWRQIAREGRGL